MIQRYEIIYRDGNPFIQHNGIEYALPEINNERLAKIFIASYNELMQENGWGKLKADASDEAWYTRGLYASSPKQFSEYDIRLAFEAGVESATHNGDVVYSSADEYIEAIKPKLVAVDLEMVVDEYKYYNTERLPDTYKPALGKDNFVIIKRLYYE